MIQWIKDNKTFIVLTIIAILLAIIIGLMLLGGQQVPLVQKQFTTSPFRNISEGEEIPYSPLSPYEIPPSEDVTKPAQTMPPEMIPENKTPSISPASTPIGV